MTGRFLDIAERNSSVEGGGDERVTQGVWSDLLVDPGPSGDSSNNSGGAMAIETATGTITEDRAAAAFTDGEIDSTSGSWGEWDGHGLAALAMDDEGAVPSFKSKLFDVRPDRFGG